LSGRRSGLARSGAVGDARAVNIPPPQNGCPGNKLYQRQIEATDRQIDALVYQLYGLTEEETEIAMKGANLG